MIRRTDLPTADCLAQQAAQLPGMAAHILNPTGFLDMKETLDGMHPALESICQISQWSIFPAQKQLDGTVLVQRGGDPRWYKMPVRRAGEAGRGAMGRGSF